MAPQRADMSPKTTRLGIFPHSIRKFVIVFMIILFLIGGIIGIIGVWKNWGVVSNVLFMFFAVASVILGILTFWPSKSNEASAPVSRRQFLFESIIRLKWGQQVATQQVPSSMINNSNNNELGGQAMIPNTNATNVQQPPLKNAPTVKPPVPPSPAPCPSAQAEVPGQTIPTEREQNTQVVPSSSYISQEQGTKLPQTETKHANPSEIMPLTTLQQARNDVEKAQRYVKQADTLFIEGESASSEQFREARSLLSKARQSTGHLHGILNTNASLPEPLKSNKMRIIAQINIIYKQIDRLLPDLKKGIQGDNRSLKNALSKIQGLISD